MSTRDDRSPITVRTALDLPALRRGEPELLAGRDGLDRPIRWVHAGEAAHIAAMLEGGELLLSTGMGIGRRAAEQRRYVDELADRGLAAVAIELGSTFAAVPKALVAQAERRGLPLIALHREIPFVAVTEALHRELVARQLARERGGGQETSAARERGAFLERLLDPEIELDEAQARERAAALGFRSGARALLALAVAPAPRLLVAAADEAAWARVWHDVRDELDSRRGALLAGLHGSGGEALAIVGVRGERRSSGPRTPGGEALAVVGVRGEERAAAADRVAALIAMACQRQLGARDAAVLSVGPLAHTWREVGEGLRTALRALPAAAHTPARPWHDATAPDLDGTLWALREQPELRAFVQAQLAPLLAHDARRATKLLPTLEAYCALGGRKSDTARALHIERQSLYHRLARIEALLGVDLSDGVDVLALHLALRARRQLERP